MPRLLALPGFLLSVTIRPTRLANFAHEVPFCAAYLAGSAAAAITTTFLIGPALGTVAEPYGTISEYLRQSAAAGVWAGAWILGLALAVGAMGSAFRLGAVLLATPHADDETKVWFGPLPHGVIGALAFVPLAVPAIAIGCASFFLGLGEVLVRPPGVLAWTTGGAALGCLAMPAAGFYYAAIVTATLNRIARIESSARCIHCGYPTRGLPTPRCPECGRDASQIA